VRTVDGVGEGEIVGPSGRPTSPSVVAVCAGTGDGLVASAPSTCLAVLTADCASVALGSPEGVFGTVHAGWRGLVAGVVEEAVEVMRSSGASDVVGALGPCIHPGCYEFGEGDLDTVAAVYGDRVRGRTTTGRPALDLPAAVSAALAASGAEETAGSSSCTACSERYFSYRARRDPGRQALVVWAQASPPP
jgi:YfiH family protein